MSKRSGSTLGRGRARGRRAIGRGVEALEPRALLATFTVTSIDDAGDGTLRDAIGQANRSPEADVIAFDPAVSGPIVLSDPLPNLTGELTIEAPESTNLTIARDDGPESPEFRIVTVEREAKVTLRRLTISGGRADLGGGIRNDGDLTLDSSVVAGNFAHFKGGGIYNTGKVTLLISTIRDNVAEGAQTLGFGPTTVGRGGGIYTSNLLISAASSLTNNRANREGGGIWNDDVIVLTTTTLAGNVAEGFALAPGRVPVGRGGAIYSSYLAKIDGSTIVGNSANLIGGGFYSDVQRPRIEKGARIEDSYIRSTIVVDNTNGDVVVPHGHFVSKGNNLVGAYSGAAPGPFDIIGVDPLLAPLGESNSSTPVRPPKPGSPVINAGAFDELYVIDQRGGVRTAGGTDIGAVEAIDFSLGPISGDNQSAALGQPFADPLVVSSYQYDFDTVPAAGSTVTFTAPTEGPSAILEGNPATIGDDDHAEVRAISNGIPGTYTVVATLNGAQEPVEFTLTNVGPEPAPAAQESAPATASASVIGASARSRPQLARGAVGTPRAAIPRPSRFDTTRRFIDGAVDSASRASRRAVATSADWLERSADRLPSKLARWVGRLG